MAHIAFYILTLAVGYLYLPVAGVWISRLLKRDLTDDVLNNENENFMQKARLIESEYSVNLPIRFYYGKKWNNGQINVVNPFRAPIVLGTPDSGKFFAVVNSYIRQQIEKGYVAYTYDSKFPDLSTIAYNHPPSHLEGYKVPPKFCVINFNDPSRSHCCNPLNPKFMTDISDAYESSYSIMLNSNRSWATKQGGFSIEPPTILFVAIIWFLRMYEDGRYCTFPHAVESPNRPYEQISPVMSSYPKLENRLSPFLDMWLAGTADQLMGQTASAKTPLSRMTSSAFYWVTSAGEFSLDINNPDEPKILYIGNNPDRQAIYGAALGLYNDRIVKIVNKKDRLKSSITIDELPTIFIKGLDNLIATVCSNGVAVLFGLQDLSQLIRDYTDKEAKVIINTVDNIFSGRVMGEAAKTLSERLDKILQKRHSIPTNRQDVSTSISTQMDSLTPPSEISGLTQGMFAGSIVDNFGERTEQKILCCEIIVDAGKIVEEERVHQKIPVITGFVDDDGVDHMKEMVQENYNRIEGDIKRIVTDELERIASDPVLKHLLELNK